MEAVMSVWNHEEDSFDLDVEEHGNELLETLIMLDEEDFDMATQMGHLTGRDRESRPLVLPKHPQKSLAFYNFLIECWKGLDWESKNDRLSPGMISLGEVLVFNPSPLQEMENAETVMNQGRESLLPREYELTYPEKFGALVQKYKMRMQSTQFQFWYKTRTFRALQGAGVRGLVARQHQDMSEDDEERQSIDLEILNPSGAEDMELDEAVPVGPPPRMFRGFQTNWSGMPDIGFRDEI